MAQLKIYANFIQMIIKHNYNNRHQINYKNNQLKLLENNSIFYQLILNMIFQQQQSKIRKD